MKRDWIFGFELVPRLVIMAFCVVAGPALLLVAHFVLVSLGVVLPVALVVAAQLLSVVTLTPLLLARYASYCGYRCQN